MNIPETNQTNSRILSTLTLSSFRPLQENVIKRDKCKMCNRRRMYFCYDCRIYMGITETLAPKVKLPINVDIIKHRCELNSKSTAIHAVLLAPEQIHIFDKFVDVPNYTNSPGTVVLCPSKQSTTIGQYISSSNSNIRRLIVLDATWNSIGSLKALPQLAKLPWVHLSNYQTEYWRPQTGLSTEHLATIEAIYFACRECIETENSMGKSDIDGDRLDRGNLDDLLFWFYFFRQKIHMKN